MSVFISYVREYAGIAKDIFAGLQAVAVESYLPNLEAYSATTEAIKALAEDMQARKRATIVVSLCSYASVEDERFEADYNTAIKEHKQILPVVVGANSRSELP